MKNSRYYHYRWLSLLALCIFLCAFVLPQKKTVTIYLIGDSTMANYADNYEEGKDYFKTRYPVTGWGQVFQGFFDGANLADFKHLFHAGRVVVDDRARGGRSTRTFFQEGRWRAVYEQLKKGDVVIMQFGHNDAAENKPERYVDIQGYKEFLRLYVAQTREKGAVPIVLTPVCRNYRWKDGHLENVHGEYPQAALDVATEMNALFIDLNQLSMDAFSEKGQEYVTEHYFMNLPPGKYEAYPEGQSDNTHFQPEGAKAVAGLAFEAMKRLKQ
ncbi:MAG: rhamnogalacturonan acetylesterase [Phaeodactylibacter sp.]|nr:rhamnogalacturonan acetylesterase [Phaeodactylibacter sp.]MCB9273871.1 rhamnogalacturonan acetylesterase [Lewinellaceae bacterium]